MCREGNDNPLQYSCLENSIDGGAWEAAVHGVAESRTWLSDFTFTFHFHALEKEMVIHSRVLAWRIPGTEEPSGLPSMGSHRIGHDWRYLAAAADILCVYVWVVQSCQTLCDPTDYSSPDSSVHGILQARILEWVAVSFSRESSQPRDWILVSCIAGGCFTIWPIKRSPLEKLKTHYTFSSLF